MNDPGNDPLLRGLAAGDSRAFAALYDRFGERLFRSAMAMLGQTADAEDAVQEVFVALVRSRKRLGDVRDLTAYLFTALRRAAAQQAARRAREPTACRAVEAAAARESRPAADDPRGERLESALSALPPEQREVIALKIDGQLTFAQIGQAMGVSINTAASRYRYALEKLRASLAAAECSPRKQEDRPIFAEKDPQQSPTRE